MTRKALLSVIAFVCLVVFAGCNTVHGIGKDIESGGKAIEKASGKGQ